MNVQFLDLKPQHDQISGELKAAVERVFDSQQFILKDNVVSLEKAISVAIGVKNAVGCASGSDALYLVLESMGIGSGDEVITTPFTFFATAGAISRTGAKPVFSDIDAKTFNIDPAQIAAKITPKTKAIIAVHLFGLPCDMDTLRQIASRASIYLIEDMAQSYGAIYRGNSSGSMSDAACLSFFPTKNLGGAGDGGMIVTNSDELTAKMKLMRVHGSSKKYHHEMIGVNSRLDEIQAAVLLVKLKYIEHWNKKRQELAKVYNEAFKDGFVQAPFVPDGCSSVYHLYSVLSDQRDALVDHLTHNNIGVGVYYPLPLHLQPCYENLGYNLGDFPVTEKVSARILSLPMYPELPESSIDYVVSTIRRFFKK